MTTTLRIDHVGFEAEAGEAVYRFGAGLNVIHGETGSGKTSLLEALKYGLGGNAILSPAVRQGVRRVRVGIRLGESRYEFQRNVGASIITVSDLDGTLVEELSATRRKDLRFAGDFLLDACGLPSVRLASKKSFRSESISFWDFYAYCYVPQSEIDRSVVGHLDPFRDRKRKAVFELLLGLTTERIEQLRVEINELRESLRSKEQELSAVTSFLESLDLPSRIVLQERQEEARARLSELEGRLDSLREEGRRATQFASERQAKLREILAEATRYAERIAELEAGIDQRMEHRFELESDRERLSRTGAAANILGTLDFRQCPRCLQAVDPGRYGELACYLCGQEEPQVHVGEGSRQEQERRWEVERVDELLGEVDEMLEMDRRELREAQGQRRALESAARELSGDLDKASEAYVSPKFDEITAVSSEIGSLRGEITRLDESLETWGRKDRIAEDIADLEGGLSSLSSELEEEQRRGAQAHERLDELSGIFDEIVRELEMPWYDQPAYVDPNTYLPMVNGVAMDNLSSGGMKMMANIAYHMALLTLGLSRRDTRIPSLLVLDSPRKNLGATAPDQFHAGQFYRWIGTLVAAHQDRSQIIIADNDPPLQGVPISEEIRVSHDSPTVPGLPHPGEGVDVIE